MTNFKSWKKKESWTRKAKKSTNLNEDKQKKDEEDPTKSNKGADMTLKDSQHTADKQKHQ